MRNDRDPGSGCTGRRETGSGATDEAYFDANAGMPLRPEAREAIVRSLDLLPGNASAAHAAGRRVRRAISEAREAVARLVGAEPGEVVFTSGATESNVLAIRGALAAAPTGRRGLVASRAEHPSVLRLCERLARDGGEGDVTVRFAGADRAGRVDADEFAALCDGTVAVATLVFAQPETGALQPVAQVAAHVRSRGVVLHTDAAQAPGRVPFDVRTLGADLVSVSAQKLGGPPGVGALVVRAGTRWSAPDGAAAQEAGRRAGTEAVPLIAGFGAAATAARDDCAAFAARAEHAVATIAAAVRTVEGGGVLSPADGRLPNTLLVAFDGCPGDAILAALDARGVRVSTGTACASLARVPSEVLLASGRTVAEAARAVRISVPWNVSDDDVGRLVAALPEVVRSVRAALATS